MYYNDQPMNNYAHMGEHQFTLMDEYRLMTPEERSARIEQDSKDLLHFAALIRDAAMKAEEAIMEASTTTTDNVDVVDRSHGWEEKYRLVRQMIMRLGQTEGRIRDIRWVQAEMGELPENLRI